MIVRASCKLVGSGRIPSDASSSGVSAKRFDEASAPRSYFSSTPLRPAASTTANARYGLHAGSGERNSSRVDSGRPLLAIGTRTRAERLLYAHDTWTGAS